MWVGSHQAVDKNNQRIYGPFPLRMLINMEADRMATLVGQYRSMTSIIQKVLRSSGALLCQKDGIHISDLWQYLLLHTNGKRLLEYYESKQGWTDCEIDEIE